MRERVRESERESQQGYTYRRVCRMGDFDVPVGSMMNDAMTRDMAYRLAIPSQTERQTDRQTNTQTDRQRDRQINHARE